jgi:hypothetical protein
MKRIVVFLYCLWGIVNGIDAQMVMMAEDDHRNNQFKSMVFRQWEFTPKSYYYSWYYEEVDLGIFDFTVKLPGEGVHDNGIPGIGGGDGYVQVDRRTSFQLTPTKASTVLSNSEWEQSHESEDKMYNQEMMKLADRTIDTEYLLKKEDLDNIKTVLEKEMAKLSGNKVGLSVCQSLYDEYDRISKNIDIVKNSHLENAKRRVAYQSIETDFIELAKTCTSVNKMYNKTEKLEKYINHE